jgi:hypothetical protein
MIVAILADAFLLTVTGIPSSIVFHRIRVFFTTFTIHRIQSLCSATGLQIAGVTDR